MHQHQTSLVIAVASLTLAGLTSGVASAVAVPATPDTATVAAARAGQPTSEAITLQDPVSTWRTVTSEAPEAGPQPAAASGRWVAATALKDGRFQIVTGTVGLPVKGSTAAAAITTPRRVLATVSGRLQELATDGKAVAWTEYDGRTEQDIVWSTPDASAAKPVLKRIAMPKSDWSGLDHLAVSGDRVAWVGVDNELRVAWGGKAPYLVTADSSVASAVALNGSRLTWIATSQASRAGQRYQSVNTMDLTTMRKTTVVSQVKEFNPVWLVAGDRYVVTAQASNHMYDDETNPRFPTYELVRYNTDLGGRTVVDPKAPLHTGSLWGREGVDFLPQISLAGDRLSFAVGRSWTKATLMQRSIADLTAPAYRVACTTGLQAYPMAFGTATMPAAVAWVDNSTGPDRLVARTKAPAGQLGTVCS